VRVGIRGTGELGNTGRVLTPIDVEEKAASSEVST
jgi:hypothetical protein